ncbi:PH-interacting protein, partial [Tanacetum coccineum]
MNRYNYYDNIVTCSRDGSAIIWITKSRKSHGKAGRWIRAYHLKVPPPPMPPQPRRGGPRQRFLPTPRGVNMIVWSLDNRFVLAAIMDNRICVWNVGIKLAFLKLLQKNNVTTGRNKANA